MRLSTLRNLFVVLFVCVGVGGHVVLAGQSDDFPELVSQQGGTISVGETVNGSLNPNQPSEDWIFQASTDVSLSINLTRTSGDAGLELLLRNANGNQLGQLPVDASGVANVPVLPLQAGSYTFSVVASFAGATQQTVSYSFSLGGESTEEFLPEPTPTPTESVPTSTPTPSATPTATFTPTQVPTYSATLEGQLPINPSEFERIGDGQEIVLGEPRIGQLLTPTEQHELLFSGTEGQILTITVHRLDGATFDPYVNIITPDGVEWDESNNINRTTRDAQIVGVELPEDGFYTITVANAIEQGTGEYLIAVGEGITSRDVEEGMPAYDEPVVDAIENYGVRDVWTIDVEAEQLISVSVEVVEEESEFDPLVEIVDPSGESLAFDDDSGSNKNAILFRVPATTTGTYRLHIAAFDSATIGSYRLWWIVEDAAVLATPTETKTEDTDISAADEISEVDTSSTLLAMRGSLDAEVAGDAFYDRQIDLETGQAITIYVEGYASFDPILEVLDADGNLVERVDDVGFDATYDINPRLTLIIEDSGRYTLRVYGYEDSGGEFSLNWQVR